VLTFIAAFYVFKAVDKVGIGILILGIIFTVIDNTCKYLEEKYIGFRLSRIVGYEKYQAYDDALLSYSVEKDKYDKEQKILLERQEKQKKQRQHEYWMSLDPYEFEKEIACFLKNMDTNHMLLKEW